MYFTYVIENSRGNRYTGSTEDIRGRLEMHNDLSTKKALFHRTTYNKGSWHAIFVREFQTRQEALDFEKFLKTGKGREWLEHAQISLG